MSRPKYGNRLTPAMIKEIGIALDRANADDAIRAVVVTADPPVFCLGCDLYELRTLGSDDRTALELIGRIKSLLDRFETFPKPIVAAVNGDAKAGGFELLLACDVVVAVDGARIGDAHGGFTLPGAGSVTRSTHRLGGSMARYLQLTGEILPAAQFAACGFVHKVVSAAHLMEAVDSTVNALCSKTPAVSRRLKSALLNAALDPRPTALSREYALFAEQTHEPELSEGVRRLNELLNSQE